MNTADSNQSPAIPEVKNRSTTYTHYASGQIYEGVELVQFLRRNKGGNAIWQCKCHCGVLFEVLPSNLKYGTTKSCGCHKLKVVSQLAKNSLTTHGMSKSRVYDMWCGMIKRCTKSNRNRWDRYGGRGIKVCAEWLIFEKFHMEMGDPPDGTTLDRIDSNGDYCKANCRWATQKEQQNNRCNNRLITHEGTTMTLAQWGDKVGLKPLTIHQRIKRGWSVSRALTTPVR